MRSTAPSAFQDRQTDTGSSDEPELGMHDPRLVSDLRKNPQGGRFPPGCNTPGQTKGRSKNRCPPPLLEFLLPFTLVWGLSFLNWSLEFSQKHIGPCIDSVSLWGSKGLKLPFCIFYM